MKNTIEVDKDEEDEQYMLDKAMEQCPKMIGGELETDSIEIFEE